MRQFIHLVLLLSLGTACSAAQKTYYRRSYFSPSTASVSVAAPQHALGPINYRGDLQLDESKRREVVKKYAKKSPYRNYASEEDDFSSERYSSSGEYSNEAPSYNSHENDSREYTIGTQIRVQHPITIPKKTTSPYPKHTKYISSSPYKSSVGGGGGYVDVNLSTEDRTPERPPKRHSPKYVQLYEPDPFHLVPPPKATAASSNSYSVYEAEQDDYDVLPSSRPSKTHERYKNVASKKQIDAYVADQKKLLDDALKLELLNDPKIQKYLKSKVKENVPDGFELDDFETYPPNLSPSFREGPPFVKPTTTRLRRRPSELKRPTKPQIITKPKRKFRSTALVINV